MMMNYSNNLNTLELFNRMRAMGVCVYREDTLYIDTLLNWLYADKNINKDKMLAYVEKVLNGLKKGQTTKDFIQAFSKITEKSKNFNNLYLTRTKEWNEIYGTYEQTMATIQLSKKGKAI